MTPEKWNQSDVPGKLRFLQGRTSARKFRLFACACCRRIWHLFTNDSVRTAVEVAERFTDGLASEADLIAAHQEIEEMYSDWFPEGFISTASSPVYHSVLAAMAASTDPTTSSMNRGTFADPMAHPAFVAYYGARNAVTTAGALKPLADVLLDMVGDPFVPVTIAPSLLQWKNGVIMELARSAYEQRLLPQGTLDNSMLAVLADALEEAGAGPELVDHLRLPDWQHYRGCWALDLMLGKT